MGIYGQGLHQSVLVWIQLVRMDGVGGQGSKYKKYELYEPRGQQGSIYRPTGSFLHTWAMVKSQTQFLLL